MPAQLNALCQIPRLYLAWNTVKTKGSAGGIDGISILEFEKEKRKEIPKMAEELKAGTWKSQPYMEIEVAKEKNPDEMRKLGMTAIRDKIVQHAIKSVIEPRYEKSNRVWEGFSNYYGKLLPQEDLEYFDTVLLKRLVSIVHERFDTFGSKSNLQFALSTFSFLSLQYQLKKKQFSSEIIAEYIGEKLKDKQEIDAKKNRKLIQERKKEYRKLEAETSGLLVNKPVILRGGVL